MGRSELETVRGGYEAFNRGDIDWMVEHMDRDISWEDAAKVPDARTYRGVDEVRRYLESFFRHWDEIRYEVEDVREGPNGIVAFVRLVARGRTSGAEVDAKMVHLHQLRDGLGVRVRVYFDRSSALADAGLQ
jgi:ketosteroid isomerase-like protein